VRTEKNSKKQTKTRRMRKRKRRRMMERRRKRRMEMKMQERGEDAWMQWSVTREDGRLLVGDQRPMLTQPHRLQTSTRLRRELEVHDPERWHLRP
jgi:hypothetical protein